MKKVITTLFIFTLFFVLSGCAYKIVKVSDPKNSEPILSTSTIQNTILNVIDDSINSQPKCAAVAEKFFIAGGYKQKTELSSSYSSHFNTKLNKCFVLVSFTSSKNDALFVDLYDVLEKKHYASFIGHNNCDPTSLILSNNPTKCATDLGNIWLDGNDLKTPADFQVGFSNAEKGRSGGANTFAQFMAYVNPFMNN